MNPVEAQPEFLGQNLADVVRQCIAAKFQSVDAGGAQKIASGL